MRECRKCGMSETQVEFKPRANICKPCHAAYMHDYRKRNHNKISNMVLNWKHTNRDKNRRTIREHYHNRGGAAKLRARYERNPRVFLSKQVSTLKSHARKPGPHDPKSGPKLQVDINLDYIMTIWESQQGKCILTGILMDHKYGSPFAVSIDRIDPDKGHTKDNVQLVCQFINIAKRHHTNEYVKRFLDSYASSRVSAAFDGAIAAVRAHLNGLKAISDPPSLVKLQPGLERFAEDVTTRIKAERLRQCAADV